MHKPRILAIERGGSLVQKKIRGRDYLEPDKNKSVFAKIRGISSIAKLEVEKLEAIDSTDMTTPDRVKIARIIYKHAKEFDGFIVAQGTDTAVETASALTFMIQGLGKPIVILTAQKSIFEYRNDAINKALAAVEVATQDFGEVIIISGSGVLRGPRTVKLDDFGDDIFYSFRVPPVGRIGVSIEPQDHRIKRFEGDPVLFTEFDTNIELMHLISGITTDTFNWLVNNQEITGIVVVGFGPGNIPQVIPKYYEGIKRAHEIGKSVVIVGQALQGANSRATYEVGYKPVKLGAISGADMTMQTAAQKLMYALGLARERKISNYDRIAFVRDIMQTNYAQELNTELCIR